MELPVIRKDVRCYWQSKSLSSVQVKNSINFFDLSKKRKEIIYNKVIKMRRFRIQRESFSLFLLLKYTHKQTENKKADTRRK